MGLSSWKHIDRRGRGPRWSGLLAAPVLLILLWLLWLLVSALCGNAVRRALPVYAARLGYQVSVGAVKLRPGGVVLSDVRLVSAGRGGGQGGNEIVLSRVRVEVSLWSALRRKPHVSRLTLDGGVVRLQRGGGGAGAGQGKTRGNDEDPVLRALRFLHQPSLRPASVGPGLPALLPDEVDLRDLAVLVGPLCIGGLEGELRKGGTVDLRLGSVDAVWRGLRVVVDRVRSTYAAAAEGYWPERGLPRIDLDGAAVLLHGQPILRRRGPLSGSLRADEGGLQLALGDGVLRVDATLGLAVRDDDMAFDLRSEVTGLDLSHPRLARTEVRDVGFHLDADGAYQPRSRHLRLSRAALRMKGLEIDLRGEAQLGEGPTLGDWRRTLRHVYLHLSVPPLPCQAALDALPRDLVPALHGVVLDGELSADLRVGVDLQRIVRGDEATRAAPDPVYVKSDIDVDRCVVRVAPTGLSAERLQKPFWHQPRLSGGRVGPRFYLGPGNPDHVAFPDLSPYLINSVLTTEDHEFMSHQGLSGSGLIGALREDLLAGTFNVGGSSITMQMVKNVLLTPERTVGRKLQEVFLAWYLEQSLSKERILEIYLNVAEFGPNLYGVGHGARVFFGKSPAELSPREAAWFSVLLPSPRRRYAAFCKGHLDNEWEERLTHILTRMYRLGRLTEEEFQEAVQTRLTFRRPHCE